jgi:hypothetical protein
MAARWKLPFPIVSDPHGKGLLQPLDLWNATERGGIAWPALLVFGPGGEETWRFRSRDFADRPPDAADLLAAVRSLGLPEIDPPPRWIPEIAPSDDPGAFRSTSYGDFFRGIRTSMVGLSGRLETAADQAEARRMGAMAEAFLEAWKVRRPLHW